jgi:hypothetical protein
LLSQLRRVVAPGSVEVVYDDRVFSADEMAQASAHGTEPATILTPSSVDTWHPPSGGTGLSRITSVMFLGYRRGHSVEEADSRTLLNVMLLKRELERRGGQRPRLIVELLNSDNVDLARMTGADDFLVSDAITSRLITQLADQPERRGVLLDLLGPDGPSVRLVEAEHLDLVGEFRWGEIVERVYSGGLLAIGWRRSSSSDGEMLLNPASSERATLESRDHVVVVG